VHNLQSAQPANQLPELRRNTVKRRFATNAATWKFVTAAEIAMAIHRLLYTAM
jgi:hypothetical protein